VSFAETVLLGAIAGFTIYLGLPLGRMGHVSDRLRVGLAMFSVGILAFIFMDVTSHGMEIVDTAVANFKHHKTGFAHVVGLFALLAVGFTAGTAGIAGVERALRRRGRGVAPIAGGEAAGDFSSAELASLASDARRAALRTSMTIAVAIGLSAQAGAIGLATVLIIGFGLHNATEGFGIVGPLGGVRPSWRWLALVGLIGGGPTFVGTIIGYQVNSDPLELCFYALAGGAILYIVGEIWTAMRRYGYRTLGLYLLAAGFLVGVATDLIVSYGGG
jgi:ZIP family zinc transporter